MATLQDGAIPAGGPIDSGFTPSQFGFQNLNDTALGGSGTPNTNAYEAEGNPYQHSAGGKTDLAAIYNNFAQYGYKPTSEEVSQAAQYWSNKDIGGSAGWIGQYLNQQKQTAQAKTPQQIYNDQQAQLQKQAPQFYNNVNQSFQSLLGRDATDAEKTHFGMLLASGQDPYQIQQALQQTTEYQNKQTKDFTDQLTPQLQSTNADYFTKYIMPSIQAQNAQAGRTQDSSGYQAQIANAGQQQNYDLQNYLAQIRASGFQGSVANNAQNYQALLGQQYGLQNAGVSNSLAQTAYNQQYQGQLQMYNMQQNAYQNYLNNYGKRSGAQGTGQLVGGILGGAAGAYYGGPTGAMAGYNMGSSLGGAAGSYL